jgi:nicotinamide mononucleotide adenylyltransferase
MHSQATTDLSIIYSNLNHLKSDKENVVLIKTGSMNPIHRSHISNMIRTKEFLEKSYHMNVLGGYISPSHDEYVQSKLSNQFIPSQHRIAMCQKAIEEENQQHWLSVDKAECLGMLTLFC